MNDLVASNAKIYTV